MEKPGKPNIVSMLKQLVQPKTAAPVQKNPEPPVQPKTTAPVQKNPEPPVQIREPQELYTDALREKLIAELARSPVTEYTLASLFGEEVPPTLYDPNYYIAHFQLEIRTGKLQVRMGNYPDRDFRPGPFYTRPMLPAEFHTIAQQAKLEPGLQAFRTQADWDRLYDDVLLAAIAANDRLTARKREESRLARGAVIPEACFRSQPKMKLRHVSFLLQTIGSTWRSSHVYLEQQDRQYRIRSVELPDQEPRLLTEAEAVFVEMELERLQKLPEQQIDLAERRRLGQEKLEKHIVSVYGQLTDGTELQHSCEAECALLALCFGSVLECETSPEAAVRSLRQKLLWALETKCLDTYPLGVLKGSQARRFGDYDHAYLFLAVGNGQLRVRLRSGRYECTEPLTASQLHQAALEEGLNRKTPELTRMASQADWDSLYDETLRAAIGKSRGFSRPNLPELWGPESPVWNPELHRLPEQDRAIPEGARELCTFRYYPHTGEYATDRLCLYELPDSRRGKYCIVHCLDYASSANSHGTCILSASLPIDAAAPAGSIPAQVPAEAIAAILFSFWFRENISQTERVGYYRIESRAVQYDKADWEYHERWLLTLSEDLYCFVRWVNDHAHFEITFASDAVFVPAPAGISPQELAQMVEAELRRQGKQTDKKY